MKETTILILAWNNHLDIHTLGHKTCGFDIIWFHSDGSVVDPDPLYTLRYMVPWLKDYLK